MDGFHFPHTFRVVHSSTTDTTFHLESMHVQECSVTLTLPKPATWFLLQFSPSQQRQSIEIESSTPWGTTEGAHRVAAPLDL